MRYSPSREPGTCILCHSIYLQVIIVLFDKPGLLCSLAESIHYFVLPSENQNAFARSADFEFELTLYSIIETARHLVRSYFLQRSMRRRVPRVKKTDEIQKGHTHLTLSSLCLCLSLSLSNCRSADGMFTLMCLHQSLSLSLCKHGLDPDQTRMVFRIERFVNLKMCACGRKYAQR